MKKHLICTALLGAIFLPTAVFSMPAAAEDASSTAETYTSGDFSYTLDDDGNATLTAYTGGKDLVLPEELDGHPVTKVAFLDVTISPLSPLLTAISFMQRRTTFFTLRIIPS